MSSNELIYDKSNQQIKNQRNCINFSSQSMPNKPAKPLNLYYRSNDHDDPCYIDIRTKQSVGPGNYKVTNLYDCDTMIANTIENATNNPMVYFKNGYDVGASVIDSSSGMRIGLTKRHPKCPQQLFSRPYLTVPYAGRGPGNIDLETQLQPGEDTSVQRSCNTLSGVTIDNYFTPLIDHLEANIQNPNHIIPEYVDPGWIRGGAPSRLVIRDIDYLSRCGYSYMDKSTNREFWIDKFKYL